MGKYLKKFKNHSQYESYIAADYIKPNVSLCGQENEMHYNPYIPPHNDIITYIASAKLTEVTNPFSSGLHINVFEGTNGTLTMTSHDFENGVGTITFDGDITTIGGIAFAGCTGLTNITIPNTVTLIGGSAFAACSSLTSITIPSSVTNIGYNFLVDCTGLISVTIEATIPPTIDGSETIGIPYNCPIYVPATSVDTYKTASGWSIYASRIQAIP